MDSILGFTVHWAEAIWAMVVDSALLLLVSFVLAGLLSVALNAKTIRRLIAGSKRREVFMTALVGVPLPLCSCSVLPVAYQLRKAGVSKAGTVSFLISTPESGVDSIMLTYSLMDPAMTVARPIAAFLTAFAAGHVEAAFPGDRQGREDALTESASCCSSSCGCAEKSAPVKVIAAPPKEPLFSKLVAGVRYGFTDLFNDLAVYLVIGYVLAGLVVVTLGGDLLNLPDWLTHGWGGYAGAIVVGLPLYICATSSTPLAAALLVAGLSPGAVLVFLLVGPATNVASLAVVSKILRGPAMARYLISIVVVAVLCGLAVDWLYRAFELPVAFRGGDHEHAAWYHVVTGALLILLLFRVLLRKTFSGLRRRLTPHPSA